ncbi:hypothetical protein LguiA_013009 [Lonicera macranthoides]
MKVDIISRELIKPSSPTPSDLKNFSLSFFDQLMPSSYYPLILYYYYDEASNITQSQMSHQLKKSLSNALTHFYPLAGKMAGESSIDCNDYGIYYVEARIDSKLKNIIDCPQVELLDQFIPYNLNGSELVNVEHEVAIQVNLFNCGGIVIGICISHKIADVSTLCTFIRGWAAMSRGAQKLVGPIFNSSSLFPPGDSTDYTRQPKNPAIWSSGERPVTKRFVFSALAIDKLKAKLAKEDLSAVQTTRVEAVSALIWKCCIAAKELKHGTISAAFHTVNVRGRVVPPLPEATFGNIFMMASAVTDNGADLNFLVGKLRESFEKIGGECLRELLGENGFGVLKNNYREISKLLSHGDVELFRFSSWCKFPVYEADFGWGKPTWISIASSPKKGCVFFMDSRYDEGIEVWLVLDEKAMTKFELDPEIQSYILSSPGLDQGTKSSDKAPSSWMGPT